MDNIWVIFIVIIVVAALLFAVGALLTKIDNLKEDKRRLGYKVEGLTEQVESYQKILFPGERRGEG